MALKGGGGDQRKTRQVLGVVILLLLVLLACGACTLLSVSPLGDAFWQGFLGGNSY